MNSCFKKPLDPFLLWLIIEGEFFERVPRLNFDWSSKTYKMANLSKVSLITLLSSISGTDFFYQANLFSILKKVGLILN